MIEIPLTQDQVAIIDDCDWGLVGKYKWCARYNDHSGIWYAVHRFGNARLPDSRVVFMHDLILGAIEGEFVDHRDHDGRNNRRDNIRKCSRSQNAANWRFVSGVSQFKGVTWDKQTGKWRAKITLYGTTFHLGRFIDEIDAAKAYNKAAVDMFGEFAHMNEIPS